MTDKETRSARDAGTMIALLCLAAVSLLLVILAAMVMPQILGIVIVVGMFLGAVSLHYVVWGWWLSAALKRDETEIEDGASSSKPE
jgi:hypothetical protein